MFIPKGTLSEALAVLNDYDHEPEIYKPEFARAKLIEQKGNQSKIYRQFYRSRSLRSFWMAILTSSNTAIGSARSQSASRSTRIVEVENPGQPGRARTAPDGNDHGYMWRLNSYWRIEEKDGGVYIQNESISLTRTVPPLLAWLINPLTKSIPRNVLHDMLMDTQTAVERSH